MQKVSGSSQFAFPPGLTKEREQFVTSHGHSVMLCPVTLSCLTVMILILISHGVGMYRNVSNIDGSFPVLSFAAHPAAAKADPHLKPGSEPRLAPDLPCRDTSGMSCGMSCSMLRHWRKGRRPWRTCLADSCSSASPSPGQFCELKKTLSFAKALATRKL